VNQIEQALQLLRQGHLVAFPTETVYGLGADATNPAAINLIYQTKGRPNSNPLILHVATEDIAQRYTTHWPLAASRLARAFWPGPLTIILPKHPPTEHSERGSTDLDEGSAQRSALSTQNYSIPDNATANLPTVALRIPNHPLALDLLRAFAGPLAAPSANRSTHVSPTTAQHVRDEFPQSRAAQHPPSPHLPTAPSQFTEPSLILDGGPCTVGIESTVLDLTTPVPTILRPGHITAADLAPIIGHVQTRTAVTPTTTAASSPGQHKIHYAPRTPAYRFDPHQQSSIPATPVAVLTLTTRDLPASAHVVPMPPNPTDYAHHLYATLHRLDTMNLPAIYIEMPPDAPEWSAIRDRLTRATRPLLPPPLARSLP
jgi:L-threonylcarbamoyladenylate synthase